MKILGGLINLANPIDRGVGNTVLFLRAVSVAANNFTEKTQINSTTDEIYYAESISVDVKCKTVSTTNAFWDIDIWAKDATNEERIGTFSVPHMVAGDTYKETINIGMFFRENEGLYFSIQGNGSGDGSFNVDLRAPIQRYSV